jgi:hypothetical protein
VSDFGAEAARWRAVAERIESGLAITVCREQVEAFARIEYIITPKRSGALADSEHPDSIAGGGAYATARYGPHKNYASFRNYGGTISKHKPGSLGTPAVGWFGHTVTQAGSHYVERSEAAARGQLDSVAQFVLDSMLEG